MNKEELLNKPIWQMTGEEFLFLNKQEIKVNNNKNSSVNTKETKLVYGIRGIANLFDCSIATANRIKKSGVIDDAISQRNRTIVIDTEKALKLFKNNENEK
ncbi:MULTISPECIES: DUF3853 family protein [Weeksellaceae]|uniref:DUF3853 family protein n=1 Tax=Bergeyella zoohelcum ATCC 43767 TaxID=883096 RepID=K1LXB6_9FLAO|nr:MULTISPECIES: DUF3853 family protein [Weeksellaceae]EKB56712.1 hypothetical protein HMPREF9699_01441 [Bergeyella zoohelcum ATCC 43767]MDY3338904.1 DUF3853 family protein [Riemerella anatipestifer]MDY3521503.1 DUF3853 family protein [Riemerella anatipestifer]MDY3533621.1 DUF3853 family protein [Riemerella anatipestifer]MDY3536026.1 DUF3853 family protein [Riemerella anatipestifer]